VGTITMLQDYRRQARNGEVLDTLIADLQARQAWISNYPQRRREQQYSGSGHVEKANDLIVARRQKRPGMQWSQETRATLATLRTMMLNGGWERDWQHRVVLPLVAT
jgi:hypothetical protein